MTKIIIASDHAGFELKEYLKKYLVADWLDLGTNSTDSVDYPDFGKKAAAAVAEGKAEFGIIVCGSGIGISIAANRNPKIRAALCLTEEMAKLSRLHNNANILALGARLTSPAEAVKIAKTFLATEFEGGRHEKRVEMLGNCS